MFSVSKMNSHLVRLAMEEEGKVRAAASCRFEKREGTGLLHILAACFLHGL
jgi:hypothetical protein